MKLKWFKKKERSISANTFCRNCEVRTIGRYCHKCGQDVFADTEQPIFGLLSQFLNKVFAFDGRTPKTLGNLIWRPGFLSNKYRAGKIVTYVHPVKLFWFSTLIFFALMISQLNESLKKEKEVKTEQEQTKPTKNTTVSINFPKSENSEGGDEEPTKEEVLSMLDHGVNYFAKFGPFVAFLLIPVFALLLALFFWRNKFFYMYHLVFALHFHTFLWIFFSLLIIVNIIFSNVNFSDLIKTFIFLIPSVYLSVAMRRFYQTKRWTAIWKAVLISFLYSILIAFVMALLIAWAVNKFIVF
jgi:predicted GIY-YIG superfamily endonuclease